MKNFLKKFGVPLLGLGLTAAGWVYDSYKNKEEKKEIVEEAAELAYKKFKEEQEQEETV